MKKRIDYTGVVQNLLYENPLYDYSDDQSINILILGFSKFSASFADLALEVAQSGGYKLDVTIATNSNGEKEEYLSARPMLERFFNIDGKFSLGKYSDIYFEQIELGDADSIQNLLKKKKYSYLFADTEDYELNCKIAQICRDSGCLNEKHIINCICENAPDTDGINFIGRNDTISQSKDYYTLRTMAFNCHMVWNKSKRINIEQLRSQFLSNYNYVACISFVISLKYRLTSIGIDFLDKDASDRFSDFIGAKANGKKLRDLIINEHKRWNVNMICRGYKAPDSLDKYVSGEQSKAKHYHPCITITGSEAQLQNRKWTDNDYDLWDSFSPNDIQRNLNGFDDLDKTSVLLHRYYVLATQEIKKNNLINYSDIESINKLLEQHPEQKRAFNKFCICIQEINQGNHSRTALYEYYHSLLLKKLSELPGQKQELVCAKLKTLTGPFKTILESEKYIDYKQYDDELIKNIPFILTYDTDLPIGIPFDPTSYGVNTNSEGFRLVESALISNPSSVTYICEYEDGDIDNIIKKLKYAIKCFDSHDMRAKINICLLTRLEISDDEKNKLKSCFVKPENAFDDNADIVVSDRINTVEIVKDEKEFVAFAKKKKLHIFEFNRTRTSVIIESYDYCRQSHYKFNRTLCSFETTNCNVLKYLIFEPSLNVSDIFEFKSSIDDYSIPDIQKDYRFFWEKYRRNPPAWKDMCDVLSLHDKKSSSELYDFFDDSSKICKYIIEKMFFDVIKRLCGQAKIINDKIKYELTPHSTGSYDLTIQNSPKSFINVIENILKGKKYSICGLDSVNIISYDNKVFLKPNSLIFNDVDLSECNRKGEIKQLLKEISDKNYISFYRQDGDKVSFVFSSYEIKNLMTKAGNILEMYVYYKLMESGEYDDVANSVEICWDDGMPENEIDIIATKGYRVIIIECKAKDKLEQNFYNKLYRLNADYCFNSVPVIIADTLVDDEGELLQHTKKLVEFGERIGIHTIYTKNDVSSISQTLSNTINRSN